MNVLEFDVFLRYFKFGILLFYDRYKGTSKKTDCLMASSAYLS